MTVNVKDADDTISLGLQVDVLDTVRDLKHKVNEKLECPPSMDMEIWIKKKKLEDEMTMMDCNIDKAANFTIRYTDGQPSTSYANTDSDDEDDEIVDWSDSDGDDGDKGDEANNATQNPV